jgi:WD40 repeat protein/3',5'-cyclic AMP phosphodiesterase CpdA
MNRQAGAKGTDGPVQIFVSYSPADERWATWIAWELEAAGYRTMLQAWDFVPGTNFIEFMDRGVSEAAAVVAVLSRHYQTSRYGRLEWQAALRGDPDNPSGRLIPVRVDDSPLEGLLATITYIDLVGVDDQVHARDLMLSRIGHAVAGRAERRQVSYPGAAKTIVGQVLETEEASGRDLPAAPRTRRAPASAPAYPPALPHPSGPRTAVTLLHVPGPRFGRGLVAPGEYLSASELQARVWADVTRLTATGMPKPDLIVVTGDMTESGSRRECEEALEFLTGLRALLGLEPHRLAIVPGGRDINMAASRAYFANCDADDIEPRPPYWPKWRHYTSMFEELYRGLDGPAFESIQPWTLFAIEDLRIMIAGLNSTIATSHRAEDQYGWIGEAQAAWFAERLSSFERDGWLRLGIIRHDPLPGDRPAGQDAALLRDAGTLDTLLAPRLNLLLHGPGPGGLQADKLGSSGLLVVPAAAPGQHQLLRLTADGLDRWGGRRDGDDKPEHLPLRWHAADGTFSSDGSDHGQVAPGEAAPAARLEPTRPAAPASLLLDRITEVCETRYERAKIRRVEGDLPHLLITYQEEGFIRQWRVAAHVGEPTRDVLDEFLQLLHTGQPEPGSELVYEGPQPPRLLREEAMRRGLRLRSFIEFQGLLDLRDYVEKQTVRLAADTLYPPGLYVPQRFRRLDSSAPDIHDDLVEELLRQVAADHGRFVLVLGDFGRGKTFALREVARRIPVELPHLIPLFIELRALDKAHSVEGLVAAHLANHGEDLIDLKAFRYMLRQGRIVLLFDGFDELVTRVTYQRATDHLEMLLRAAEDKAKIVVASRTQHFKSHEQVFTALGERVGTLPHRRIFAVEDFTPAQIRAYLVGRYHGDKERADHRLRLLSGIQDLLALSSNPRMLGFIADLDEERLRAVAGTQQAISAAGLYEEILRAWLAYEEERTHGVAGSPGGMRLDDLWQAVTTLAMRLWESGETLLRLADLAEVADTLSSLAGGRLSADQRAHAMGSGSLLVRTDEGLFGFIHASVVEWLVAAEIAGQLTSGTERPAALAARPLSQLAVDFLCDLAGSQPCQAWTARILADPAADEVARANAMKVITRLRTPAQLDLRGASLKGEDLSYRELEGVDLTGADLTEARLVGTNLARTVLRGARLTAARLDEAQLIGADLRGADLTRSRLARADLRGAVLAGSRWTRAALVDVSADPGLAAAPELHGAAVTPGQPVQVELAPAAIGVPYGFSFQTGQNVHTSRLPEPLAYSHDGGLLALGGDDGGVLICDTVSGRPVRTLRGHRGRVYAVAFGGGDKLLASGSSDGTVRLWDPATGDCLRVLDGHRDGVWPVVLSPDGGLVVTGDGDGVLRIWDSAEGRPRMVLPGHTAPIYTAAFSPQGTLLAVGDAARLSLYDAANGTLIRELGEHLGPVYRAVFSAAGDMLATSDRAGMVRLWDPGGELRHEMAGHTGRVYTLAFHPQGHSLASGDTDGQVRLWNPRTGQATGQLTGHRGAVYWVTFSPQGDVLASCDSDGHVQLWDPAAGQARHQLAGHKASVWPIAFRPDGRQLATSGNDGSLRLWDPADGQCGHVLRGHGRRVTQVRFSPAGDQLATIGNDGMARLWHPRTGQQIRQLAGTADRLISVLFSPAGDRLATASNDGGVYLWNAASGAYEREMGVETDHLWAEAFSPASDVLATANDDDTVQLWDCTTGRHLRTFADHSGRVRSIAFSPDGTILATGCDDRAVRLWDIEAGTCLASLTGHTDRVYSVVFGRGGELLASASNDGTARLWDVASAAHIRTLAGHEGRLWSAAFSPDGAMLATAGDDLAIRLWDPQTGTKLRTLTAHTRRIWSVAFSPDGALASAGDDGTIRLWDISGDESPPALTLLGLPEGWAALAPDGRYKQEGDVTGQFWLAVGMCRFDSGELDSYLPEVRRLPLDQEF